MVDDDNLRGSGAIAHARDKAIRITWTVASEALLTCRRDVLPERKVVRQILDFCAIAGLCRGGPFDEPLKPCRLVGTQRRRCRGDAVEPMQADIICATFHVSSAEVDIQRACERRQILVENLILKRLCSCRDQHATICERGGHKVGECLAGPGACFSDEHAAFVDDARDRRG